MLALVVMSSVIFLIGLVCLVNDVISLAMFAAVCAIWVLLLAIALLLSGLISS